MSLAVIIDPLVFKSAGVILLPIFIDLPCWWVWEASHEFPSWACAYLGFMANSTTSEAFQGVTVSNNMPNSVTCPTSNLVIVSSTTSSTSHSLMIKVRTRKSVTIKSIFIPGTLVPSWSCLSFEEFALRWSDNFFKHFLSSKFFVVMYKCMGSSFVFTFGRWWTYFWSFGRPSATIIFVLFLLVPKTRSVKGRSLTIQHFIHTKWVAI